MIAGKPLLRWVAERLRSAAPELELWFAVDDPALSDCLAPGGFRVVMTRPDHASGTDRIAEANRTVGAEEVINVQADEPLVSAGQIGMLRGLIGGSAEMATLANRFKTAADFRNPNQVKVVCNASWRALYFSRAPMPYPRDRGEAVDDAWVDANPCYRHLGLYAYKARLLEEFPRLPRGHLEAIEHLEQLRVLESGREIAVGLTQDPTIGVDTPEDARRFEEIVRRAGP